MGTRNAFLCSYNCFETGFRRACNPPSFRFRTCASCAKGACSERAKKMLRNNHFLGRTPLRCSYKSYDHSQSCTEVPVRLMVYR